MATEATRDALIDLNGVPSSEQANLNTTQTPNGTVVTNSGTVSGLTTFVRGNVEFTGGQFNSATFNFTTAGSTDPTVGIRNTTLNNSNFNGTSGRDIIAFGGNNSFAKSSASTSVSSARASLGNGQDSISFLNGAKERKSTYDTGAGADSITFGKGSFSNKTNIGLGRNDGASDIVSVSSQKVVKKLIINDFGVNDSLRVGRKTYDYYDLESKNGKIGNIKISFD